MPRVTSEVNSPVPMSRMIEHRRLSRLPIPEPETFHGDYMKYPGWKVAFQTLIGVQYISSVEKMYYLRKYIAGDAKACIEGCFLINTTGAYEEAFRILDDRFGDNFLVASAFRDKLDAWPCIDRRDGKALQKLADFLVQCTFAMRSIQSL